MTGYQLDLCNLGFGPGVGYCEHSCEASESIKGKKLLDKLSN
jgi:hypothetical protein